MSRLNILNEKKDEFLEAARNVLRILVFNSFAAREVSS